MLDIPKGLAEGEIEPSFFRVDAKSVNGSLVAEEPCAASATFHGRCSLGAYTYIGNRSTVRTTEIGRYSSIATDVTISPPEHPVDWFSTHPFVFDSNVQFAAHEHFKQIANPQRFGQNQRTTKIGNDVWIGRGAIIRRGVTIGDGAIIGAGAIVNKDVEPYEIVGGIPAKHIRFRFDHETIVRFRRIQWWDYDLSHDALRSANYSDVRSCLDLFETLIRTNQLNRYSPRIKSIGKTSLAKVDPGTGK